MAVKGEFPDRLAIEIFWFLNTAVFVEVDGGMPEGPVREDGDGAKGRVPLLERAQEVGHSEFRNLVLAAYRSLEDLSDDRSGVKARVRTGNLDGTVGQCAGAIVIPKSNLEFCRSHCTLPLLLTDDLINIFIKWVA